MLRSLSITSFLNCPHCHSPLHPKQRRCNHCATRVAYCSKCNTFNRMSDSLCLQCKTPLTKTKSYNQLESEYNASRRHLAIRFPCICGKLMSVALQQAGKQGKCPKCGYKLLVPSTLTPPPAPSFLRIEDLQKRSKDNPS
jgi:hypothetical protein